ncbi:MAG: hypothetical protein ASARMPREDX12_002090 [Alectoria sarmentosa]|nr:MAG: hypothetical protein ASARMPREDX12_002090 [Alectoria sarmentosa]
MASGPTPPGIGPTLARVMSDPTLHKQADTEAKVAIEKAIAEETLQMYCAHGNSRIVHKGPFSAMPAEFQNKVPKEHTALWHVSNEDDMLLGLYVYVHAEAAEINTYLLRMKQLMEDEIKEAEVGGRLRDRKVFGIAQMGMSMSFFLRGSGGLEGVGLGGI